MFKDAHHLALERMYSLAPVNRLYLRTIQVNDAGAVQGSRVFVRSQQTLTSVAGYSLAAPKDWEDAP